MKAILIILVTGYSILQAAAQAPSTRNTMYVERNVFYLKFGASSEAIPMWKDYLQRVHQRDQNIHARLLTDVSGPAYTLILEIEYESFSEMEPSECRLTNQPDWKEFYRQFIPLCEKAERTYYKKQMQF
ncbi:MAG: hypothetical protein HRU69_07715 [Flammeovirgaceae bacterium]|nr:MAG: hypothetical protein HRU69_07715 [Flammeovirgaceae bacterium]